MPRPPRIDFPDAVYHVTSRGNGRAEIFWTDDNRQRFLGQLSQHLQMTGVVLYAYVLMDNHFHGLVRTPRANLSGFMQRLLTAYALYARYQHRRPGHLFQGRFKAKLVEDDVYLRAVTRYIHLNPVKIAACRRLNGRQRLERLNAYPWSSYAGYVAADKTQEFVSYDVLKEYGRDQAAARRQYRAYTEACLLEDDAPLLEAMAVSRYAIGGAAFTEKTEVRIEERRSGRVQDRDVDLPRWTVALEEIDAAVARRYGVDPAVLKTHGHHAGPEGGGRGLGLTAGEPERPPDRAALRDRLRRDWCYSPPAGQWARRAGDCRIADKASEKEKDKVQSVSLII